MINVKNTGRPIKIGRGEKNEDKFFLLQFEYIVVDSIYFKKHSRFNCEELRIQSQNEERKHNVTASTTKNLKWIRHMKFDM